MVCVMVFLPKSFALTVTRPAEVSRHMIARLLVLQRHDCNSLNANQKIGRRESWHKDHVVSRWVRAIAPPAHSDFDSRENRLSMLNINRPDDNVLSSRSRCLQAGLDIFHDLVGLGGNIAFAHDLPLGRDSILHSDVDGFSRIGSDNNLCESRIFVHLFRIEVLNRASDGLLRHGMSLHVIMMALNTKRREPGNEML